MVTTLITFRNGKTDLADRITDAVAAFRQDRGHTPPAVVVPKIEFEKARAAVAALGLELEVRGTGGCLIPEVWLQAAAEKPAAAAKEDDDA